MNKIKFNIRERNKHLIVIDYKLNKLDLGFIEIYINSGVYYTNINFNGFDIKTTKKIFKIANSQRYLKKLGLLGDK